MLLVLHQTFLGFMDYLQQHALLTSKPILPKIASEHNGAIGEIKLNENGDLESSDYSIYEIDNAEWVVIGSYFRNGTIIFNDQ